MGFSINKRLIAVLSGFFVLALAPGMFGQHHSKGSGIREANSGDPGPHRHQDTVAHCLKECFTKGHAFGHVRNYTMATVNQGELVDYWANAIGGSLGYHTAEVKGFSIGLRGIMIYHFPYNNLDEYDSLGGGHSKYELQLFDIEDPENRHDLDRLEELYLQYRYKHSFLRIGKQDLYTPLMNRQDTRMKPYVVSGAWAQFREVKNLELDAGWFFSASPRSTTRWHKMNDAVGLYANGFTEDGLRADYRGRTGTKGIGVLGAKWSKNPHIKLQAWNYWLHNINNTVFLQADFKKGNKVAGMQYLRQDPVQGHTPDSIQHNYLIPDQRTNLISARVGLEDKKWEANLNATYILGTGRFVFPRELGREQFFTTIGRGRMEGMGNAWAFVAKGIWRPHEQVQIEADLARVYTEDGVSDYTLNKYGTVSYDQFNLDIGYHFKHLFQGLDLRFLYVVKRNHEEFADRYDLVFNKSNYHHFNLVMNLDF